MSTKMKSRKMKKTLLWILALTLTAGLVYAAADLMGQTNSQAADACNNSTDMEMATLDSVKKPAPEKQASNVNWGQINSLDSRLKGIDAQYKSAAERAGAEKAQGSVSEGTRSNGMALAQQYNSVAMQLADAYQSNNMITRANTVRQLGKTRLANADMTFNNVDSDRISAYRAESDKLSQMRKAYFAENDLSAEDKAALKSSVLPRVQASSAKAGELVKTIGALLLQVTEQTGGIGGIGNISAASIGGCAKKAATDAAVQTATTGDVSNLTNLIGPLKALLSLVEGLSGDSQSFISDLSSL